MFFFLMAHQKLHLSCDNTWTDLKLKKKWFLKELLNYNVTWSPCTLIKCQLCKIIHWWIKDLMFVNEKKKKKESFAAFICHQLYLHNPGGISESNASGQHLPGEQSAPTVHISLGRRPSLSVTGVSFSTTKWQFIT